MNQGLRPLKSRMLFRLVGAEGWTQGPALAEGLSTSRVAIEDALADLVLEKLAEFKPGVGYRLNASPLCREAAQQLRRHKLTRCVRSTPVDDQVLIAVAEIRPDVGLVMYELALPKVPPGPDEMRAYQAQLNAILKFSVRETSNV